MLESLTHRLIIAISSVAIVLAASGKPANAAILSFSLFQTGWEGGGEVTGMFSGEDANGDGYISLTNNEVISYAIEFSGNATTPSFTHDLNDLKFFRYTLGSSGFRPSSPLFSDNNLFAYDADDYTIYESRISPLANAITTVENATVKAVPEPSSTLGTVAFVALGSLLIKRKLKM